MSQTQSVQTCPVHGVAMVPVRMNYAFAPRLLQPPTRPLKGRRMQRVITAVVLWDKREGRMTAEIFAADERAKDALQAHTASGMLGEWIANAMESGELFPFHEFVVELNDCYRIDDRRDGHMWSYMVWMGRRLRSGGRDSLLPRTIYYCYGDGEEEHRYPPLEDFDAVCALMHDPSVLEINDVGELGGRDIDDPEVMQRWDLNNRVVVYDLGEIQRKLDSASR